MIAFRPLRRQPAHAEPRRDAGCRENEYRRHEQSSRSERAIGNDLQTAMPMYGFAGLVPGDRWCVTAANWLRAHLDGAAAFVVLASTHERALEIVPLQALREHAVDVPSDPGDLTR